MTAATRTVDEPHEHAEPGDVDTRVRWIRHARATMILVSSGRPVTPGQLREIAIALDRFGIVNRDQALGFVACVVGRPITSRKSLTSREASAVLDTLEDWARFKETTP